MSIQVLPYVPSFGEKLASSFGQAAGDVAGAYFSGRKKQSAVERLEALRNPKAFLDPSLEATGTSPNPEAVTPKSKPFSIDEAIERYKLGEIAHGKGGGKLEYDAYLKNAELEENKRIQNSKENVEAHKLTADYREKILNGYEASKKTLSQLGRLEKLNKEGKLTSATVAKVADSFGIPLSILANPESEEFEKVSQDLLGGITQTFGNRILKVEVENFLKTIPTLMNSTEGRERVIRDLKILQEANQINYDAYKEVKKENGGKVPLDLHERVLEKTEGKLDELSNKFKEGFQTGQGQADNTVEITAPNGQRKRIPKNMLEQALQAGGTL